MNLLISLQELGSLFDRVPSTTETIRVMMLMLKFRWWKAAAAAAEAAAASSMAAASAVVMTSKICLKSWFEYTSLSDYVALHST